MKQTKTTATKKNWKPLIIIGSAIAIGLAYYAAQKLYIQPAKFDKEKTHAVSEINKNCPLLVDQETRLDKSELLPNNVLKYNFTLVNQKKEDINMNGFRAAITPGIVYYVKTAPDLKMYRDNGSTIVYSYKDKNGAFVLKVSVTPDMYE
jgi:hypothetical protein